MSLGLDAHVAESTSQISLVEIRRDDGSIVYVDDFADADLFFRTSLAYIVAWRVSPYSQRKVLAIVLPEMNAQPTHHRRRHGSDSGSSASESGVNMVTSKDELKRIVAVLDLEDKRMFDRELGWISMDQWASRAGGPTARRFTASDDARYTWSRSQSTGDWKCCNDREYFVASYHTDRTLHPPRPVLVISPSFRHIASQLLVSFLVTRHLANETILKYLS
ncbi:hypothetical protein BKA62DRAFT_720292 [Auriculariales sp. MPI-PUGE-AT-0066]|nr:hypothetical protein BKA62DRAFT_720292 [Auriculariales sp. MPI-PUGE-AT-0066]